MLRKFKYPLSIIRYKLRKYNSEKKTDLKITEEQK